MRRNGFTLIELLVVVAIIGILAAVGVVAYSGYTAGAKLNAVKANQKMVINFIMSENKRCEIGETKVMGGNLNCSNRNTASILNAVQIYFNDTATTEIYTLSLHDALPILSFHPLLLFLQFHIFYFLTL